MTEKLKGIKTYAVAALTFIGALLAGVDWAKVLDPANAPEVAATVAAGIAFGRALVSLFRMLRAKGAIA